MNVKASAMRTIAPGAAVSAPMPHESAVSAMESLGVFFLIVFLFLTYSRFTDTILAEGYVVLTTSLIAFVFATVTGGLPRAFGSRVGVWLAAFTVWLIVAVPFSFWPGGSVHLLRQYWIKSFFVFVIVAGIPRSVRHCRLAAYTIAIAVATIVVRSLLFGLNAGERLILEQGVLANANSLAQFLLMGLPFMWLMAVDKGAGLFRRVVIGVLMVAALLAAARTGSREALLGIACLVVAVGLTLSGWNQLKLIAAAVLALAIVLPSVSDEQRARYMTTLGHSAEEVDDIQRSALDSREQRLALLKESVALTLQNPVFGVGPGVFDAYSAKMAEQRGERAHWQVTHNAYTQISSEAGIPALVFYAGALFGCFRLTRRVARAYKTQPDRSDVSQLAYCLWLSLVSFSVVAFFDSVAYQMYFPTLAGLCVALYTITIEQPAATQPPRVPEAPRGRALAARDVPRRYQPI